MGNGGVDQVRRTLRFVLDGSIVEIADVDPTLTVLRFLREERNRTGTKEGCAEGDCGACTVVVVDLDDSGQRLRARAVNACIQFLPTLDGKELLTVESLSSGGLHPVQQAMVECHGSQCGFCTPGFIMSLFALYKNQASPTRRDIDHALAGNLCRCTGYQPIVDAAEKMYGEGFGEDGWMTLPAGSALNDDEKERVDRLRSLQDDRMLHIDGDRGRYFAPRTIDVLASLVARHPDATLLAGGTDVGLWVTKQNRDLGTIIYTGAVSGLPDVEATETHVNIGAAATITDAMPLISDHFPELDEIMLRFASPPIRNAGTIGGNVANGSPIGDSMPALIALGTDVVLRRGDATRTIALEDFYLGYQQTALQTGEFVERLLIPFREARDYFASYKLSKRFDQDISAVCGAFLVRLDGDTVTDARIAYGGMAEIPKRAAAAEQALIGSTWSEAAVESAMAALARDFSPITDMRSTREYRARASANLLRRFWLETSGESRTGVYAYGR